MSLAGLEKWHPESENRPDWVNPYWPIAICGYALALLFFAMGGLLIALFILSKLLGL